jgi:BTB/POZ domain-containing protein KCTD9
MKFKFSQFRQKTFDYFKHLGESPIMISFLVLFLLSLLVIGLSLPYYLYDFNNFYAQVLAEAHGMLFDIAVIGILIFWLNNQGERRRRIRTYIDEIDDFRLWLSEESAFRTAGNIKRLNRHKIYDLNLAHCYLSRTNLNYVILKNANLNLANIAQSQLIGCNLENARLNQTNFDEANLNQGVLKQAYAGGASFKHAQMIKVDLRSAFLIKADFENAVLMEADLSGADVSGASFKNANLFKANLLDISGLTIEQLCECKSLQSAKISEDLRQQIELEHPALLGLRNQAVKKS